MIIINIDIRNINKNIPVNKKLLNKYSNVKEMVINEINNNIENINIESYICELDNINIDVMTKNELSKLAIEIFEKYNMGNVFVNDGNRIMISRGDVKESLNKIFYNSNQKLFLKEHLNIFSKLGKIIEYSQLSSQTLESKSREYNNIWSYYLINLTINNRRYLFEFDVVSRINGENHYRVQRLVETKKADISVKNVTNYNITSTLETSALYDNDIIDS